MPSYYCARGAPFGLHSKTRIGCRVVVFLTILRLAALRPSLATLSIRCAGASNVRGYASCPLPVTVTALSLLPHLATGGCAHRVQVFHGRERRLRIGKGAPLVVLTPAVLTTYESSTDVGAADGLAEELIGLALVAAGLTAAASPTSPLQSSWRRHRLLPPSCRRCHRSSARRPTANCGAGGRATGARSYVHEGQVYRKL